jgi:hypothetical protein
LKGDIVEGLQIMKSMSRSPSLFHKAAADLDNIEEEDGGAEEEEQGWDYFLDDDAANYDL